MKGVNFMYGYWGKVTGMVMTAVGIVLLAVQKLTSFIVFEKLNSAQHFNMIMALIIFGLVFMTFSKEKHEDERVQQIRGKAFMTAFGILLASSVAVTTTFSLAPSFSDSDYAGVMTLTPDDIIMAARLGMTFLTFGFVVHLAMFHIGLYFDQTWDYKDETWTPMILLKNLRYRIIIMVALLILIEIIFRLFE